MQILIFGATGNIGRNLSKTLVGRGHFVASVSRNPINSQKVLPYVQKHLDFNNTSDLSKEITNYEVVINLVGYPVSEPWTKNNKKLIYESRINTTKKIVELINQANPRPKKFISSSAIGYYGNGHEHLLTIDSPAGVGFLANVCVDWEEEAKKVSDDVLLIIPRIGIVLDKTSGALPKMALPFRYFLGAKLGDGKQWMSWIHIVDLVNLLVEFVETNEYEGLVNAVSPNPVRNAEFSKTLAKVLNRPCLFSVPKFIINLLYGEASSMLFFSQKVFPEKLIQNDFEFKYPTLERALVDLLK